MLTYSQKKEISDNLIDDLNINKKYYVYILVDPRDNKVFYVGKGCGDRIFQHVENAKSLINADENETSLKIKQINEIMNNGDEVKMYFVNKYLTENEAFTSESTLINVFNYFNSQQLTNIQSGHHSDGMISVEDYYFQIHTEEYDEPSFDYIIVKVADSSYNNSVKLYSTSSEALYEESRKLWKANIERAKKYKFVLSVRNSIVKEIYEVEKWYQDLNGKIGFIGHIANGEEFISIKGKHIPSKYKIKGNANPFLYKK